MDGNRSCADDGPFLQRLDTELGKHGHSRVEGCLKRHARRSLRDVTRNEQSDLKQTVAGGRNWRGCWNCGCMKCWACCGGISECGGGRRVSCRVLELQRALIQPRDGHWPRPSRCATHRRVEVVHAGMN